MTVVNTLRTDDDGKRVVELAPLSTHTHRPQREKSTLERENPGMDPVSMNVREMSTLTTEVSRMWEN